ncbi:MAG: tetratricopeptide repeat protein [bacterium]|nr:tetratricopeptide repeat protein [bacterium]
MTNAPVVAVDTGELPPHILDLLRHDHARLEPRLDEMLAVLGRQGAHEIWHKHGTFYEHLLGVWRILAAWGQPPDVRRLGLMHSVYSNSVVRMKVFDAAHGERADLRRLIGDEAERLVHLFCSIRREELLFGDLETPAEGIRVGLHGGDESVQLSRHDLGVFLIVTMADYAEQFFGWQDRLFGTPEADGTSRGGPHALWPGDFRPGLWMAMSSRFGRRAAHCGVAPLPPVFERCSVEISRDAEVTARDLYWQVSCDMALQDDGERAERALREAIAANPFIAEPHVLLAQLLVDRQAWDEAAHEASAAQGVLVQWATPWDKRLSWEAWVAWSRVLCKGARERDWPRDGFRMMSLGEVRPGR